MLWRPLAPYIAPPCYFEPFAVLLHCAAPCCLDLCAAAFCPIMPSRAPSRTMVLCCTPQCCVMPLVWPLFLV
ncbi:hypothetical protein DENSPDRAFT_215480 [Dentipellis sp. KUC8613]|nr:hypothetical protein DENSPDRAFT_215480 [Dentipellis sp. KUC8613]